MKAKLFKSSEKRTISSIPLEQWKKLYECAAIILEMRPWKWLKESDVLGIYDKKTGWIGYNWTLGESGDFFSTHFHLEAEGAAGLMRLLNQEPMDFPTVPVEASLNALSLDFSDRASLTKADLALIRRTKVRFKDNNLYPQFRRLEPCFFPWYLTKTEAGFLERVLPAYIDMAESIRVGRLSIPDDGDTMLIRTIAENGSFTDKDISVDELSNQQSFASEEIISNYDREEADNVFANTPATFRRWGIDWHLSPEVVQDSKNSRPFYPAVAVIVDYDTKTILDFRTYRSNMLAYMDIVEFLVKTIKKMGSRPKRIATTSSLFAEILRSATLNSKIKITLKRELKIWEKVADTLIKDL